MKTEEEDKETIFYAARASNWMFTAKVPTDFVLAELYHDPHTGEIISPKGQNLTDYLTETKINPDQYRSFLKSLFGQMVLAIADLHTRRLVHRDIKPPNFLVFIEQEEWCLKLSDLDDVLQVNAAGNVEENIPYRVCVTKGFVSPELFVALNAPRKYKKLDLRRSDCYALGCSFEKIVTTYFPDLEDPILTDLLRLMTVAANTSNGITQIEQVRAHPFFGPQAKELFRNLRYTAQRMNVIINDYPLRRVRVGNPFNFLPAVFKPICWEREKVAEAMAEVQVKLSQANAASVLDGVALERRMTEFLLQPVKFASVVIEFLKTDLAYDLIYLRYLLSCVTQKPSNFAKIPCVQYSADSKNEDEQNRMLCYVVECAVAEYLSIHREAIEFNKRILSFFFHAKTGEVRALKVRSTVRAMVEDRKSTGEILEMIYLELPSGSNRKYSFNSILMAHLTAWLGEPLENWMRQRNAGASPTVISFPESP